MAGNDEFELHSRGDFFPPPAKPRRVSGGIRAQARRGEIAQEWWSQRWIAALEAMGVGGRLARGRAYARAGQVVDLSIEVGAIRARVQGSRRTPYETTISVEVIPQRVWAQLARALAGQALYAAQLMAGTMPDDIETVFAREGVTLFPGPQSQITTTCSCPDWERLCKHAAAACYLVGEQLDRDPFVLLRLRGIEREALVPMLAGEAARQAGVATWQESPAGDELDVDPDDPERFWHPGHPDGPVPPPNLQPPPFDAPVTRMLGAPPLWRGSVDFQPAMERICRAAARAGFEAAL